MYESLSTSISNSTIGYHPPHLIPIVLLMLIDQVVVGLSSRLVGATLLASLDWVDLSVSEGGLATLGSTAVDAAVLLNTTVLLGLVDVVGLGGATGLAGLMRVDLAIGELGLLHCDVVRV